MGHRQSAIRTRASICELPSATPWMPSTRSLTLPTERLAPDAAATYDLSVDPARR